MEEKFAEKIVEKAGEAVKYVVQRNMPSIIEEVENRIKNPMGDPKPGLIRVSIVFDYEKDGSEISISGMKLSYNRKVKFEDKDFPEISLDENQLEIDFEEESEEELNYTNLSEVIFNISDIAGTKRKVVCPCLHGKKGNMDKWEDGEEVACNHAPAALVVDAARKVGAIVIDDNWMMSDEDVRWLTEEGAHIRKYENGKWWIPGKEDGWEPLPKKFEDFAVDLFVNEGGIVLPINTPR